MNYLVSNDIVEVYQPLMDIEGSYSAQYEHVCTCHMMGRPPANFARQSCYENHARRFSVEAMTTEFIQFEYSYTVRACPLVRYRLLLSILFTRRPFNIVIPTHSLP
jgi:hypothetical protein